MVKGRSLLALGLGAIALLLSAARPGDLLWQHRNLGKAFYENPTTYAQSVAEFKKALDLAPESAREHLNYGLALLRAGRTQEGIAEIEKAQKIDPRIPHTWFNLGIAFKKEGEFERAIPQLEQMIRLVPDEPVSHYNLGVLYGLASRNEAALREFETAAKLNPNLAGPHFKLYNSYRQAGRTQDAARELAAFQEIKKRNEGAAVPEDMEWSYYSEIYETQEPKRDANSPVLARFDERRLPGSFTGFILLDADGDGRPDILAWSAAGATLFRGGAAPGLEAGLGNVKDIVSIAAGDFDNDGFPDLCVITPSGAALYRNVKGRFEKQGAELPAGRYAKAVWLDYDHDYDLDLFLLGQNSALARNSGEAGFGREPFPFVAGDAIDGAAIDLIADTSGTDLAVSYRDRAGVIYRDRLAGKYEPVPVADLPAGTHGLTAFDADSDGWTDLTASGLLLLNRGGKLERAGTTGPVFADLDNRGFAGAQPKASAAADFDGDGRTDLVVLDGALRVRQNRTASKNNWVRIALAGVKNLKLAPGAEVEVKAGASYQKRTYEGVPLVFGLDGYREIDTVRITWPNGLIQNEPRQPVNQTLPIKEAPRLSGSCPMIFTWNGAKFEFLTDVLGVAPLGASSGDGKYFPVDHDEYVRIPGAALRERDGAYEIRITEELREVSYIDQVKLIALDHPAGMEVFTNEKFKAPPFPEFRLYAVRHRIYPRRMHNPGFRRDAAGAAELHTLDLDFGHAATDGRAVLLLDGWVDWADGSTFLQRAQAHRDLVLPYLQVKDAAGQWRTVIEDMGIPAGKPKTIAVDLSGKFLSKSREIRIVTNLCVYWKDIFLSEDAAPPLVRMTEVPLRSADLHFRGFSQPVQPVSFDYSRRAPASMWNPTPGLYTRYGEVRDLIGSADDRMVVMGSGDEMILRFAANAPPPRTFLLLVDGWAKDGDYNTAFSQSVAPLPFHAMSQYPYSKGEHFPDDAAHRRYLEGYNTRPALRLIRPLR